MKQAQPRGNRQKASDINKEVELESEVSRLTGMLKEQKIIEEDLRVFNNVTYN